MLPAHQQTMDMLAKCARDLKGLGQGVVGAFSSRERDFLMLGSRLETFANQAQAVADSSMELARQTASQVVHEAINKLSLYLENLRQVFDQSNHEQSLEELSAISSAETQLAQVMSAFRNMVKHLSMLGIATRIESARLGSEGLGFSTLADDVETLAGKIAKSVEEILSKTKSLGELTGITKMRAASIQDLQRELSLTISESLQGDMRELTGVADEFRIMVESLAEQAQNIYNRVSQTVISLQFHDIIRQQLEHISESLNEAWQVAADPGDQDPVEVLIWLYDVLGLQIAQLANAKPRFSQAMAGLSENLLGIAHDVQGMTKDLAEVRVKRCGGGTMTNIEQGIGQVSVTMANYQELSHDLAKVMGGVSEAVQRMTGSVADIEEVGSEIELIAINASIKAARTGEIGAALGVLASAIQKLSVDARNRTDSVTLLLEKISQSSLTLNQNAENLAGSGQLKNISSGLEDLLGTLKGMDRQMVDQLAVLANRGQSLGGDVENVANSINFPADIIAVLDSTHSSLSRMVQGLTPFVPPGNHTLRSKRLDELMRRYTMEAERLVHSGQGGKPALNSLVAAPKKLLGTSPDHTVGDNVELF